MQLFSLKQSLTEYVIYAHVRDVYGEVTGNFEPGTLVCMLACCPGSMFFPFFLGCRLFGLIAVLLSEIHEVR